MKKNNLMIILIIFLSSLMIAAVYIYARNGKIKQINKEIDTLMAEKRASSSVLTDYGNIEKMLPEKPETTLFIERLYDAARVSNLKKHEVVTLKHDSTGVGRTSKKEVASESKKTLMTHPIKISIEGDYRNTAEYIREVQNIQRLKRITDIKIKPAGRVLRTDITVNVFSLGGQNAPK